MTKIKKQEEKLSGGKRFQGVIISDKMQNTVVVLQEKQVPHPFYRKVIVKRKKFYAHNPLVAREGDLVEIRETRPLSKLKRFVVTKIIKKQ